MRTHVRSLPRPMSPPLVSWMVVAVALIVAEALVGYLLRRVAAGDLPESDLSGGCLVVSSVWGLALGVVTARSRVGVVNAVER
jgi:hypothetical protein